MKLLLNFCLAILLVAFLTGAWQVVAWNEDDQQTLVEAHRQVYFDVKSWSCE